MSESHVPALVKRLRRAMRLTQEKLAQEIGVSFSTVNQWENGRRHPQPFLLKKLEQMEAALATTKKRGRVKG